MPPLSAVHEMAETIERRFDALKINRIANHPDVIEWIRGYLPAPLDLSDVTANEANVCLVGEHGAMVFMQLQPTLFECHTLVEPKSRGEWAKTFVHACIGTMFTRTPCMEIVTRIPKGNLGARTMANLCKFQPQFVKKDGWVLHNDPIPAEWFSLDVKTWMLNAPGMIERGRWFHDHLESEFKRLGKTEENHPDDDTHDQVVGATYEMLIGGQTGKAEVFYNRWAAMAGYHPIRVASPQPLIVDIASSVLCVNADETFYVMKVR